MIMKINLLLSTALISLQIYMSNANAQENVFTRIQEVRPLPGSLDKILMINDNNPELITEDGILLSTFPDGDHSSIPIEINGRFDLFSHHVYAGNDDDFNSTLWLALLIAPLGDKTANITLLEGSTSLSQSTAKDQTASPFLPLPTIMRNTTVSISSGPGSRVAGDIIAGRQAKELNTKSWEIKPGDPKSILQLPIPVEGLDPLLNGRNLHLRLHSSAPVSIALIASHGKNGNPPDKNNLLRLLRNRKLSTKEHPPTPRGVKGSIIYSRVSGVQIGSTWKTNITDKGKSFLSAPIKTLSWPISSLIRGTLGTNQIQTAELAVIYPGTAWAAHGNYGVEYNLTLPIKNEEKKTTTLEFSIDSPIKTDKQIGGLKFRKNNNGPIMFRGPIAISGLETLEGKAIGKQIVHLVLREGQKGPSLGRQTLIPGERKMVNLRLVYPADATPPQVLTVRPVKQS